MRVMLLSRISSLRAGVKRTSRSHPLPVSSRSDSRHWKRGRTARGPKCISKNESPAPRGLSSLLHNGLKPRWAIERRRENVR
jgi:hypothetical protein